eukprot:4443614-Prymnesium_polylepis.1
MQREEGNARGERDEDPRLLKLFTNQQDPSAEGQLAAHLERLPPERGCNTIARQEPSRAAQRRLDAGVVCVPAREEKERIKHRRPNWPYSDEHSRSACCRLILVRITAHLQIVVKIPTRLASIILDRFTTKSLEDACRCAGDENKRYQQHKRQAAL